MDPGTPAPDPVREGQSPPRRAGERRWADGAGGGRRAAGDGEGRPSRRGSSARLPPCRSGTSALEPVEERPEHRRLPEGLACFTENSLVAAVLVELRSLLAGEPLRHGKAGGELGRG